MGTSIVTVDVNLTIAPTPPTLQATGALVSQGGTTLTPGTTHLLTQLSDLTALLVGLLAVTSITQSAGLATVTTTVAHGIPTSDIVELTISGATPLAYNGTHACTATGASTLTFAIASGTASPATGTIKYTPADVAELLAMGTTYFAQSNNQGVYVIELGDIPDNDAVSALKTYIDAHPNSSYTAGATGFFYGYLVPRSWADETSYPAMTRSYSSPQSRGPYFWTTVTQSNYTNFAVTDKQIFAQVEAPGTPTTEFSLAADFNAALSYRPSPTNKVPPFAFTYLFGVTSWATANNMTLLTTLLAANTNYVGTGAEGGISTAIIRNGTTRDGRGYTYWYSVDALQIYSDINISNAIINGSNNRQNPLYYNQEGIDRLQAVEVATFNSLVTWGLANGQVFATAYTSEELTRAISNGSLDGKLVVNAVPLVPYLTANPGDYAIGEYDGLTGIYITQNGFIHILFTVNVTDFAVQA